LISLKLEKTFIFIQHFTQNLQIYYMHIYEKGVPSLDPPPRMKKIIYMTDLKYKCNVFIYEILLQKKFELSPRKQLKISIYKHYYTFSLSYQHTTAP